jgi:hypothetical protein
MLSPRAISHNTSRLAGVSPGQTASFGVIDGVMS